MKKSQKVPLFLAIFFIAIGTAFSFYYAKVSKEIKKPKVAIVSAPGQLVRPFSFIDQDGDTVTRKVMDGKVAIVEYFFTTCKGICPKMNENMAKVYQAYRNSDDVIILSHTVDPEHDSVAAMKAYSLRFDADPKHWLFLTGNKKELYDQAKYSYLLSTVDSTVSDINEQFIHSNLFVLVDKRGRLRMHIEKETGNAQAYDGTNEQSVADLIADIKVLQTEE